MNKEQRKQRFSLTILFSGIVFIVLAISVILTMVLSFIASKVGIIDISIENAPKMRISLLVMAIISLVIGFGVALIAMRYPLKPVNNIITQMNRLASGDFKARLKIEKPLSSHPVFREVVESFNKMAEELEGTEMLRSDFINNFSHEFKTPIVSIAGFAKLLNRGNLTEEQKKEYALIIEEESLRLAAMANNVLNLTKIENQSILTDVKKYNLSEQIRSSVLLLESKWTRKNTEFSLEFDEFMICGNEEMLKQVWINLIDNAIKFSPEYGLVKITITQKNDTVSVSVINSGDRIAPEHQKKIWNKFYQADESHSGEGNGIGLAIVKKIAELHGGNVSMKCENKAIIFTVELPSRLQ